MGLVHASLLPIRPTKGESVTHTRGMMTLKYHNDPAAALAYVGKRLSGRNDGNGATRELAWFGDGAERLGLHGAVEMKAVEALCGNRHPAEGWTLVPPEWKADAMPLLTELVVSSLRLPAVDLDEDRWFTARHREAAGVIADLLEAYAGADLGCAGSLRATCNVVGMRFDRCCIRQGTGRLSTHFVLFNLTFDKAEDGWSGLDTSEMELALPDMADEYAYVMRHHCGLLALLEALACGGAVCLESLAHPSSFGLN